MTGLRWNGFAMIHSPPEPGPVPPLMPEELRVRDDAGAAKRGCSKSMLAITLIVFIALIAVTWPVFLKQRVAADRTTAISHLKCIALQLFDFDANYGRFPDAGTIAEVQADTRTDLPLGTRTSNDFFRQLLATGIRSERIFWAPKAGARRPPDDRLGPAALAPGECIYSYVPGLRSSSQTHAPIAMAPMIPGTSRFDAVPYQKAVILRCDGSVRQESIAADGRVKNKEKDLFDPSQPFWQGRPPRLKWPE
jgi:hypothetical protein